jgi:hypothetical protein
MRRVLLGSAALLFRNIMENIIIHKSSICGCVNPRVGALHAEYKGASKVQRHVFQNALNLFQEVMTVRPLWPNAASPWVVRISVGGKSTYAILRAMRPFERACSTGAGAITPSAKARWRSNLPPVLVGAIHFGRQSSVADFHRIGQ